MSDGIDYRELLIKYMCEVLSEEGVSFRPTASGTYFGQDISDAEIAELATIEQEAVQRIKG